MRLSFQRLKFSTHFAAAKTSCSAKASCLLFCCCQYLCLENQSVCHFKVSQFVTAKLVYLPLQKSVSLPLQSKSACRCKVRKFVAAKSVGLSLKSQSVCYCKVSQFVVFAAAKAVIANCTFAAANLRMEPQTCTFGFVATTFCSCNTPIVASTG